jgi:hypothetical protein
MRELLFLGMPPLAIAVIYCIWKRYFQARLLRAWKQRRGITEMLWAVANQVKTKTIRPPKS